MATEEKTETSGYEAPELVILGPAEDLTRLTKPGSGSDAISAYHQSA